MEHYFERCSCSICYNGNLIECGNNDDVLMRQYYYKRAGLVLDYEKDICIREGYGALVFCCGKDSSLDEVIEKSIKFENFYDFPGKINQGYKFVIGPGISIESDENNNIKYLDYAVYCSNYEEILEMLNNKTIK